MPSAFTPPEPLRVTCRTCRAGGFTFDYAHPGRAVDCGCCPVPHDHDEAANACARSHEGDCGLGVPGCAVCRPVTITGRAHLRLLDVADLMEETGAAPAPEPVQNEGSVLLWPCLTRPRQATC